MDHSAPSAALRASLPLPLMAAIAALPPLAVDMYLPAFPQIAGDLATNISVIQNSLSLFLVGFGCGMLLFGPYADRYGRRPLALFGLAGFAFASLLILLSHKSSLFLPLRLLQGFLGSAATVTIPAMIRDCYGKDTAKGMSTVTMIMLVAPLVAPLIGSWILAVAPWQGLFIFLSLYALVLMVLSWWRLPETRPANLVPTQQSHLRNYRIIFSHPRIYWDLSTYILLALAFFVYLTSVSFIYITWFGVSETRFGYLFACSAAALLIANFTNRQLVTRVGSRRMLRLAMGGAMGFTLLFLLLIALGGGLWPTVMNFFCLVGCLGVAWVNADSLVIMEFPQQAGSATAVIGTLRFGFGGLAGPLLAVSYNGTPMPVAILLVLCLLGAVAIQLLRARHIH